jgi:predicted protein tyrosine phosphatase
MIYVCGLDEMPGHVSRLRPERLVSLVRPEEQPATPPGIRAQAHLRLEIDDVEAPAPGWIHPDEVHIQRLIEFLRQARPGEAVLMHCLAGISRSPAAALIALALDAVGLEGEAARHLRVHAPHAEPNRRMIAVADRLLEREGRLIRARAAMGSGEPPLEESLVVLPPLSVRGY